MAREIVLATQRSFERVYGMLAEYVEVCPENIWAKKSGGWPIWQQVAHAVRALDVFVCGESEIFLTAPCDVEVLELKVQGSLVVSKAVLQDYSAKIKMRVDAWFLAMKDSRLLEQDVTLSKKIGRDFSYMATALLLGSHTIYHLGSCDAALRDHGLPGVF